MISIDQVREEFNRASEILSRLGYDKKIYHFQVFSGKSPLLWDNSHPGGCRRHISVFDQYNVIPQYCFNCYKVSIKPATVIELFKLMMIFENLKLENNNTRKCIVEIREEVHGAYTGLIYCRSIQQGYKILEQVKTIVHEEISSEIPIALKRGCSEFPLAYPEYAEFKNINATMSYPNPWLQKEIKFDHEHSFKHAAITFDTCEEYSNYKFKRAIALYTWIRYAAAIDDSSYLEITDTSVTPLQGLKRPASGTTLTTREKNWDERNYSVQDVFIEAYQFQKSGNYQKAKQGYQYVLRKNGSHLDANHLLGVVSTQEGDYKYAIHQINKVLQKIPDSAEANFNLGNVYFSMESYHQAIHFYSQALNQKPDYLKALINIGISYKMLNMFEQAIEKNEQVLATQPNHAMAHANLGDIYSESGNLEAAFNCYMKSIESAPQQVDTYCRIAALHVKTGDKENAISFYQKAIALTPDSTEAHFNLANIYLDTHQFAKAETHFDTVLQYSGDHYQAHNGLGCALSGLNKNEKARIQFNKALSIKPDYDSATVNLDKLSNTPERNNL